MCCLPQSCGRVGAWVAIHWHAGKQLDLAKNANFSMYNNTMHIVIETNDFIAWSANVWGDAERGEFIDFIS